MTKTVSSAETVVTSVILACVSLSAWLEFRGVGQIAWTKFAMMYLCALALILMGVFYRTYRRNDRIAVVLIVTGLYIAFSNAGATLNYLLFSNDAPRIDRLLMSMDAALGFKWAVFVSWFEGRETLSRMLRLVYQSSLFQLLGVICLLGFSGHVRRLHEFMLVGVFSSLVCIILWSLAPSFGPTLLADIPAHLRESLRLAVDVKYMTHLSMVAGGQTAVIEPSSIQGLIAFPSMHTVMAAMTVFYTMRTVAFRFVLALNTAMLPAILLHGGHHLMDVFGGLATFACVLCAVRGCASLNARLADLRWPHPATSRISVVHPDV